MINIVDEYIASQTIILKEYSNDICIVNLVWKGQLLLLSYNFSENNSLDILSYGITLEDEECVCIEKIISQKISRQSTTPRLKTERLVR